MSQMQIRRTLYDTREVHDWRCQTICTWQVKLSRGVPAVNIVHELVTDIEAESSPSDQHEVSTGHAAEEQPCELEAFDQLSVDDKSFVGDDTPVNKFFERID